MPPIPPYTVSRPHEHDTPVVFSSPHSGRDYPAALLRDTVLDPLALRSSEDAFVDDLFGAATACGAPLIAATAPRAWIDVNRARDELDPSLIRGVPHRPFGVRVASGLGVIPRVVANGRAIYARKLSRAEAEARIAAIWLPYHAALERLMDAAQARFGCAILIDCHSMPPEALDGTRFPAGRPDVVLGDRFGAAAAPWVTRGVEAAFRAEGFAVLRNMPFAGAHIAERHGAPARGRHVVQVEIDRALYLDPSSVAPGPGYDRLRARLDRVVAAIATLGRASPAAVPMAAE